MKAYKLSVLELDKFVFRNIAIFTRLEEAKAYQVHLQKEQPTNRFKIEPIAAE